MPARLFDAHVVRPTQSLDGFWTLHVPGEGRQIEPANWRVGEAHDYLVPSVWETIPGLETYRGQAVARRVFRTDREGPVRLVFRGVSHTARVWIDGREIGGHHNAYTPFALHAGIIPAGEHELLVHISNEHGEISALHVSNDYYNYGGVSRPAEVHCPLRPLFINRVQATPIRNADGAWGLRLHAFVENIGAPEQATLAVEVGGHTFSFPAQEFSTGVTEIRETWVPQGANFQTWSPDAPNLYFMTATLADGGGEVFDDWIDRIGFRVFECRGDRLFLNGDPVFLQGFNRHEDHTLHGSAMPLEIMYQDILIMRDLHCNAVRTSHYPNDERFLDLCDQFGLMVWEENHARGLGMEAMQHPRFRDQCRDCIDEMIAWHFNRPSIVIWGILNECVSDLPEGRELYAEQFQQVESLDRSRPTTFASCKRHKDICQDLPDIISWNIYPNWYSDNPVGPVADDYIAYAAANGGAGKPFIFSEFGAGAIPGYIDMRRRSKFSENRQAELIDELLEVIMNHPKVSGAFIWQFCDVRVDPGWAVRRPREINDKGIVDGFRQPKLAYDTVRRHFAAKLGK